MPKLPYSVPPDSLLTELREVANDAASLADALRAAQNLPADFPAIPLLDLMARLRSLPDGTAEGCREPLEYADRILPAIRRRHIRTEAQSAAPSADPDALPPLTRGMTIDRAITALLGSVTTALDEYRSLAAAEPDETDTSPSLAINPDAPDTAAALAAARAAEDSLGSAADEFEVIARPESRNADNLKRLLRDARGLFGLARIQIRMPEFVPRWFRKTVDTIRDYPALLRGTLDAIDPLVDLTQVSYDNYHHWKHGMVTVTFDAIRHWSHDLRVLADKWDRERAGEAMPTRPPPDFDLAAAHRTILAGDEPPILWRPFITGLDFGPESEKIPATARPDAEDRRKNRSNPALLVSLAPLAKLSRLEYIIARSTNVGDLTSIAKLTELKMLVISDTQVADLSPITNLAALEVLSSNDTQVTDLTPIGNLRSLHSLYLSRTQIADLSPVSSLTALQRFYFAGTQVADLSPIANLISLHELFLTHTLVADLSPIANLIALHELYLAGTQVADLTPIANLTALRKLLFWGTKVSDLAPIANLTELQMLHFWNTEVVDLTPVANLSALQDLDLSRTKVADLTPIADLTALRTLDFSYTPVADLTPIANLTALQTLNLEVTQVTDLTPIQPLIDRGLHVIGGPPQPPHARRQNRRPKRA